MSVIFINLNSLQAIKALWVLFFVLFFSNINAQSPSDCEGAIPLCTDVTSIGANTFSGLGAVNDEQNASCWSGAGAAGSVWYVFSPMTDGNLGFQLDPVGTTDYDFALFDITNSGCANLTSNELISCNYSGDNGNTGMTPVNGDYQDSYDTFWYTDCFGSNYYSADADCGPWNETEPVLASNTYVLMVNFYSGSNDGFTIDFQFQPGLVNIDDNIPPGVAATSTPDCVNNTLTVNFTEPINCSSIQAGDFTLTGPGGPYTITSIDTSSCVGGTSNSVVITTSPTMTTAGNYNLNVVNVIDACGNNLNAPGDDIALAIAPITAAIAGNLAPCGGATTTLTALPSGATISYSWSTGATTSSISPSADGNYSVTITDQCGFSDNATVTLAGVVCLDICNDGNGNLVAIGGSPTYTWSQNTGFFGAFQNKGTGSPFSTATSGFDPSMIVRLTDGTGDVVQYANLAAVPACPLILPIGLKSFTSECRGDFVQLEWSTATETNNDYFIIEKADDRLLFDAIAEIDGAGFSKREKNYFFRDYEIESENVYYRMVQVDFDGRKTYKSVISGDKCHTGESEVETYYSSETREIIIEYKVDKTISTQLKLYNTQGRIYMDEEILFEKDKYIKRILIPQTVKTSIYILQIVAKENIYRKKLYIKK